MRFMLITCLLLITGSAQAQYPYFAGTGPYRVPPAAWGPFFGGYGGYYGGYGGSSNYGYVRPAYQLSVPGYGVFAVRDARDVKMLQANLAKRQLVAQPGAAPTKARAAAAQARTSASRPRSSGALYQVTNLVTRQDMFGGPVGNPAERLPGCIPMGCYKAPETLAPGWKTVLQTSDRQTLYRVVRVR